MDISEFKRLHTTSHYSRHPWEIARVRVLRRLLRGSIPIHTAGLVDIGSGDAYVIHEACRLDIARSYYAIDVAYTPEIVQQLQDNNPNSPVRYFQTIESFQEKVPAGNPTLFLCMDVLEHLKDEREVLDHIAQPGITATPAYYFFTVPAFQSVFSNHDVLLGHYRRYTVRQFRGLLTRQGLTVTDSGYFFLSLLIARWFERKLLRKKDYSIDNWGGGPIKTRLLTGILGLDFTLSRILKKLGIRLPGLSCYCICRL